MRQTKELEEYLEATNYNGRYSNATHDCACSGNTNAPVRTVVPTPSNIRSGSSGTATVRPTATTPPRSNVNTSAPSRGSSNADGTATVRQPTTNPPRSNVNTTMPPRGNANTQAPPVTTPPASNGGTTVIVPVNPPNGNAGNNTGNTGNAGNNNNGNTGNTGNPGSNPSTGGGGSSPTDEPGAGTGIVPNTDIPVIGDNLYDGSGDSGMPVGDQWPQEQVPVDGNGNPTIDAPVPQKAGNWLFAALAIGGAIYWYSKRKGKQTTATAPKTVKV